MVLNRLSTTRAARALLVAGVLMLLLGACSFVRSAPTDDDTGVAFTEVSRCPRETEITIEAMVAAVV